jgi:hypothetical protein
MWSDCGERLCCGRGCSIRIRGMRRCLFLVQKVRLLEVHGDTQETLQNTRKCEIYVEIPGRIEHGKALVEGGESTDFWRIGGRVWCEKPRSTRPPSLAFPCISGTFFANFFGPLKFEVVT